MKLNWMNKLRELEQRIASRKHSTAGLTYVEAWKELKQYGEQAERELGVRLREERELLDVALREMHKDIENRLGLQPTGTDREDEKERHDAMMEARE